MKDHEELYEKTNDHFKGKARKGCLWERFTFTRNLSVKVFKTWFDSQRTLYSMLMQSKSGQALKVMMEHQNLIQDEFVFLKWNIRCKGPTKSSNFKSQAQGASASAASAHEISRASKDADNMEFSM